MATQFAPHSPYSLFAEGLDKLSRAEDFDQVKDACKYAQAQKAPSQQTAHIIAVLFSFSFSVSALTSRVTFFVRFITLFCSSKCCLVCLIFPFRIVFLDLTSVHCLQCTQGCVAF